MIWIGIILTYTIFKHRKSIILKDGKKGIHIRLKWDFRFLSNETDAPRIKVTPNYPLSPFENSLDIYSIRINRRLMDRK